MTRGDVVGRDDALQSERRRGRGRTPRGGVLPRVVMGWFGSPKSPRSPAGATSPSASPSRAKASAKKKSKAKSPPPRDNPYLKAVARVPDAPLPSLGADDVARTFSAEGLDDLRADLGAPRARVRSPASSVRQTRLNDSIRASRARHPTSSILSSPAPRRRPASLSARPPSAASEDWTTRFNALRTLRAALAAPPPRDDADADAAAADDDASLPPPPLRGDRLRRFAASPAARALAECITDHKPECGREASHVVVALSRCGRRRGGGGGGRLDDDTRVYDALVARALAKPLTRALTR